MAKPPEYRSSRSVDKNKTLNIDIKDPRLKKGNPNNHLGRSGTEVQTVNGVVTGQTSTTGAGANIAVANGTISPTNPTNSITIPPINNQPPAVYPGGSGPYVIIPTDPSGVSATWSGDTLTVSFTWDSTASGNATMSQFTISLTNSAGDVKTYSGFPINTSSSNQTITITPSINTAMFNIFTPTLTSISVRVSDALGNVSNYVSSASIPTYTLNLPVPTISVTSVNNGYSVSYTTPSSSSFSGIDIWEIESSSSTAPAIVYASDGITPTNYNRVYLNSLNPAVVISPDTNKRWVIARFASNGQIYTAFSSATAVTPTAPVTINVTAPTEVTVGTVSWSGSNIVVPFTIPSTNSGIRYLIKLTAPNSQIGYFYFFPDGTSNLNQSHTITKSEIFAQFGQYFSSFSGVFVSYSVTDVPSSGVSFNVPARANGLSGVTPTPTVIAVVDGYTATFDFSTVPATYAEVYEKFTNTAWPTTPPDAVTMSYVSGGAANATTLTVNNVKDNDGNTLTSVIDGYIITGTGIPANTYVSSVSGSAPTFTLTLSNPLTTQASGTYSMQGLVYSGPSPANIFNNLYIPTSVVVRYYDDFGNASLISAASTVTPINPTLSLIQNAVQVGGTSGAIYVGSSASTGARIVLGVDSYYNTNNTYSGIFAYDGSATTGTAPTTSIISNAGSGGYTFSTINAKIADWAISSNKIESLLISGITKYTGLSASNTNYAFWAGATSPSNSDNTAPFSVTPLGAVKASNITISGGQLDVGADSSHLSSGFHVTPSGTMYATGAIVNGNITATGGSFTGNVQLNGGSLYALGAGGTVNSGIRTIFNSSGIAAYNSSGGYAEMLTSPLADGSVFATTAANIGGWGVNSSQISKTGITGKGNIVLDSTNGYIYVSDANTPTYTAGINSVSSTSPVAFWAGTALSGTSPSPAKQTVSGTYDNKFVVQMDGTLYATGAQITGNITATSAGTSGNTIKLDSANDYISLSNGTNNAYIIPRNNNLYITAPSASLPFTSGTSIDPTAGPSNGPYFSAGSSFTDYWGNTGKSGIGIFTGAWNYFSGSSSTTPFVAATTTGVQISGGPNVGMIVEKGGATGDAFSSPTLLIYTSNNGSASSYSPATQYGAYIQVQSGEIDLVAQTTAASGDRASGIGSKIVLKNNLGGLSLYGLPVQGDADLSIWFNNTTVIPKNGEAYLNNAATATLIGNNSTSVTANGHYRNALSAGPYPRQRMLIEDPVTGQTQVGMAVYYSDTSISGAATTPSSGGAIGDLWVIF